VVRALTGWEPDPIPPREPISGS